MKNIFILSFIFCLISCNSNKNCIEKYLIEEENLSEKKVILFKNKSTFTDAINDFIPKRINQNPTYDELKFKDELVKKYSEDKDEVWEKNDFKKVNFIIFDFDSIQTIKNDIIINQKINYVFSLSKPYFFNKNKNVFFRVKKYHFGKYRNPIKNDVVIMEKNNGKWFVKKINANTDL